MKLSKITKMRLLGALVAVLILSAVGTPTYLYLKERENVKQQALNASFQATFGNVTILGFEELTKIPVAVFRTKTADGKEYTVLAGEFGSSWVILTQKETTQVIYSPAVIPTSVPAEP